MSVFGEPTAFLSGMDPWPPLGRRHLALLADEGPNPWMSLRLMRHTPVRLPNLPAPVLETALLVRRLACGPAQRLLTALLPMGLRISRQHQSRLVDPHSPPPFRSTSSRHSRASFTTCANSQSPLRWGCCRTCKQSAGHHCRATRLLAYPYPARARSCGGRVIVGLNVFPSVA